MNSTPRADQAREDDVIVNYAIDRQERKHQKRVAPRMETRHKYSDRAERDRPDDRNEFEQAGSDPEDQQVRQSQ